MTVLELSLRSGVFKHVLKNECCGCGEAEDGLGPPWWPVCVVPVVSAPLVLVGLPLLFVWNRGGGFLVKSPIVSC